MPRSERLLKPEAGDERDEKAFREGLAETSGIDPGELPSMDWSPRPSGWRACGMRVGGSLIGDGRTEIKSGLAGIRKLICFDIR